MNKPMYQEEVQYCVSCFAIHVNVEECLITWIMGKKSLTEFENLRMCSSIP